MKYANGDIYEGNWILDKKSGHFKITTVNKEVYTGICENDNYIGEWTLTKADKTTVKVIREGNVFKEVKRKKILGIF